MDMDPEDPLSFWRFLARLRMDKYDQIGVGPRTNFPQIGTNDTE